MSENSKQVLVVDDEPGILRFVRTSLTLAGYTVIITTSGEEAVELVRTQKPDIMLLDILMSPVTGFDVLAHVRSFSKVPIIIFTARQEIVDLALKEGADDYISKPFKPEDLIKKIQNVLGSKTRGKMELP